MMKSRFQFHLSGMMLFVLLAAFSLLYLRPSTNTVDMRVDIFGDTTIRRDGTVEVQGGMVRIGMDKRTEIRGDTIIIQQDGTICVDGKGSIKQGVP